MTANGAGARPDRSLVESMYGDWSMGSPIAAQYPPKAKWPHSPANVSIMQAERKMDIVGGQSKKTISTYRERTSLAGGVYHVNLISAFARIKAAAA